MQERFHTVIVGAGAAGLMAAAHAGLGTLVLDHAAKPAEKVRISGGGRCNFTNLDVRPEAYLGENPHFAKSALARYTQWDFLDLMARHGLSWSEKTLGQLFCDQGAKAVVALLVAEAQAAGAEIRLATNVSAVTHADGRFRLATAVGPIEAANLVIATGGKSIPKMGASGFAYDIARQFGHRVTETRPGLVPLTFGDRFAALAGVATRAKVGTARADFTEQVLFTHRGLSGPAILQASSYWRDGEEIILDLAPDSALMDGLRAGRASEGRKALATVLAQHLPARLVAHLDARLRLTGTLADQSDARLAEIVAALKDWHLTPTGSEGYRTAEVTLGGVATERLSSTSMESRDLPGLYFIGEAVDVTGWLGGYNFQWAWASGAAAGRAIAAGRSQEGVIPDRSAR